MIEHRILNQLRILFEEGYVQQFFCTCILQTAIDFAEVRSDSEAAKLECVEHPAYHLAPHHAPFSASAFCKLQLILRRLPILARQGVAGVAPIR